jgi:tRNA U38,U39,U40 pseudouridine synthase TruA
VVINFKSFCLITCKTSRKKNGIKQLKICTRTKSHSLCIKAISFIK